MAQKKSNVEIVQPDPNFRSREWDWHVWEQMGDGKEERWIGFFRDTATALAWAGAQPGNYKIDNVPPMSSNQRSRRVRTGFPWDKDEKRTKTSFGTGTTAAPRKRQSGVSATAPIRRAQRTVPVVPVVESTETKAMKKDAKVKFEQHKAAEAKELAAEEQQA